MTSDGIKSGVYLVAIAAAAYVAWQAYEAAKKATGTITGAAATVGGWVNPASDQNLAYQAVNAAGSTYTGQADWTLGGAIYDTQQARGFTNPWQIFLPSSAGVIASEIGNFFDSAPAIKSGGGGTFNGTGASGAW